MHLNATLLASGIADGRIPACSQLTTEKRTVRRLLDARYAIDKVPAPAHDTLLGLIHRGLQDWWRTSRYNVPLSTLSSEVMVALSSEVTVMGLVIYGGRRPEVGQAARTEYTGHSPFCLHVLRPSTDTEPITAALRAIQEKMDARYKGLIFYWRVDKCDMPQAPGPVGRCPVDRRSVDAEHHE